MKLLSHVWLFATPWTAAYQAPPSMGFSRQEYWSGVPLPSPTGPQISQHNIQLCLRYNAELLNTKQTRKIWPFLKGNGNQMPTVRWVRCWNQQTVSLNSYYNHAWDKQKVQISSQQRDTFFLSECFRTEKYNIIHILKNLLDGLNRTETSEKATLENNWNYPAWNIEWTQI